MSEICDVLELLMDLPPPRLYKSSFVLRFNDAYRHLKMRPFFSIIPVII